MVLILAAVFVGLTVVAGIAVVAAIVLFRSGDDANPPIAANDNTINAPGENGSSGVDNGRSDKGMELPFDSSSLPKSELKSSVTERVGRGMSDMTGVLDYWDRKANHSTIKRTDYSTAPKSPIPLEWKVEVDPAEEITYRSTVRSNPIEIKIPAGSQSEQAKDIVFPVVPSRVVSVGQHADDSDRRLVYDIPTKTSIGVIRGFETETVANAISPDGKLFVGLVDGEEPKVKIWDVEKKELSAEFSVPDYPQIAMPTASELMIMNPVENAFSVFHLDGTKVCEFKAGEPPGKAKQTITFSPGGKYVAVMVDAEIPELNVFEISTGDLVGETTLPHYEKGWGSRPLNPLAITFSPNGEELAYAIEDHWQSKLIFIDVASAQVSHHITLKKSYSRLTQGRTDLGVRFSHGLDDDYVPLRWFPDNKHILIYEHAVMQTATGTVVHLVPKSAVKFVGIRYPVANDLMTVLNVSGKKGSIFVYSLSDQLPPAPERERNVESDGPIQRTPSTEFAIVDTKDVDRSRVVSRSGTSSWNVEADPITAPTLEPLGVPIFSEEGILASLAMRPGVNIAAVSRHSRGRQWGGALPQDNESGDDLRRNRKRRRAISPDDESAVSWVDIYDLQSQKRIHEVVMPYQYEATSISPNGTQIIGFGLNSNQIDIMTLQGESVVSFVPYEDVQIEDAIKNHRFASSRTRSQSGRTRRENTSGQLGKVDFTTLLSATFIDDESILTMSTGGDLDVWNYDGANVSHRFTVQEASIPSLSPGGKYVACMSQYNYLLLSTETGDAIGQLPMWGSLRNAVWNQAGNKIAFLIDQSLNSYIQVVDATTGETEKEFPIPFATSRIRWVDDNYLLLNGERLVDMTQGVVAWTFTLEKGDALPVGADYQMWFVGSDASGEPVLSNFNPINESVMAQIGDVVIERKLLLGSGDACKLEPISLGYVTDNAAINKVRSNMVEKLTKNGFQINDSSNISMVIRSSETQTGTKLWEGYLTRSFSPFAPTGPSGKSNHLTFQAPDRISVCTVSFQVDGKVAWESKGSVYSYSTFFTQREGESPESVMLNQYRSSIAGYFGRVQLPNYIFTPESAFGIGETTLTVSATK